MLKETNQYYRGLNTWEEGAFKMKCVIFRLAQMTNQTAWIRYGNQMAYGNQVLDANQILELLLAHSTEQS